MEFGKLLNAEISLLQLRMRHIKDFYTEDMSKVFHDLIFLKMTQVCLTYELKMGSK